MKYNPPKSDFRKTGIIIALGAMIIFGVHYLEAKRDAAIYVKNERQVMEQGKLDTNAQNEPIQSIPKPLSEFESFIDLNPDFSEELKTIAFPEDDKAKIVLIFDDLGMDLKRSREIINLPAPLTLAFLPYAPYTRDLTRQAQSLGHETIIHVPMEAMDSNVDLSDYGLKTDLSDSEINQRLEKIFNSFSGYVGLNNHMGSKLTQDERVMGKVMQALKDRDLMFIDSKTIHSSVGAKVASGHGVPFLERDVFLDHIDTEDNVLQSLAYAEIVARKNGLAVVIGHPKDNTIGSVSKWISGLEGKNIEIIPARSAALLKQTQDENNE